MSNTQAVVKEWKLPLKNLGFSYLGNLFLYHQTPSEFLSSAIQIQRNLRTLTYKVNLLIRFRNPLLNPSSWEILLIGNLCHDGISLYSKKDLWLTPEQLSHALLDLEKYAIPWFQKYGQIAHLAKIAEAIIDKSKSVHDMLEPLDKTETKLPWLENRTFRPGPVHFYQAAILNYLNGDKKKAIARTNDWLNAMGSHSSNEKAKALHQLDVLMKA